MAEKMEENSGLKAAEKAVLALSDTKPVLSDADIEQILKKNSVEEKDMDSFLVFLEDKDIAIAEDSSFSRVEKEELEEEEANGGTNALTSEEKSGKIPDSLSMLFANAKQYKLLNRQEEMDLSKKILAGDEEARDTLVNSNLRLVASIAARYARMNRGVPYEDIISYGFEGLITAAEKFDYRKGCRFSTFASYWIRQSISRDIGKYESTVKIPSNVSIDIMKVKKAQKELTLILHKEPDYQEISDHIGDKERFSPEKVEELISYDQPVISLDRSAKDDDTTSILDLIPDPSQTPGGENSAGNIEDINAALDSVLNPREKKMVEMYYGINNNARHTLEEVGQEEGVTRERARQIIAGATKKMRAFLSQGEEDK